MDAKRIEMVKAHLAASQAENVKLAASDLCALVTESKIDDEGLQKAAKSMAKHVGFVAVSREKAAEMLLAISAAAVSGQRSAVSQTSSTGKASGTQNKEQEAKS